MNILKIAHGREQILHTKLYERVGLLGTKGLNCLKLIAGIGMNGCDDGTKK